MNVGPCCWDVAYFLNHSCMPDDVTRYREFATDYYAELLEHGPPGLRERYPFEDLWEDMRLQTLFTCQVMNGGAGWASLVDHPTHQLPLPWDFIVTTFTRQHAVVEILELDQLLEELKNSVTADDLEYMKRT